MAKDNQLGHLRMGLNIRATAENAEQKWKGKLQNVSHSLPAFFLCDQGHFVLPGLSISRRLESSNFKRREALRSQTAGINRKIRCHKTF
jgi:hypothetical protein